MPLETETDRRIASAALRLRGQIHRLEMLQGRAEMTADDATELVMTTNKILDTALDLSKLAAIVERAVKNNRGIFSKG